ncbi:cation diffusion facilitator family transporter [uncultured Alistipes sp.]|uniref:cation diffusion facilitator family transporter n=1 Tax=uncultured Alistipes sp. TaxID=538949 RepID=UPI00266CC35E|nr:cation diffusion facilitator family transporter [uncultured Alistipes sp.]
MAHRHDPSAPSHGHLHAGHRHEHRISSLNRAFLIGIALNVAFVVVEFVVGLCSGSMGLLSDAGHNLSDVASLLLAMLAFRLARVRATSRYTYGYRKSTVLISLLNSVILLVAVGVIVAESVGRMLRPEPVAGGAIAWTAGIGVLVNGFTAWLFLRDKEKDLNVRGAYLHMAADALVSIGVLLSGVVIAWTGWTIVDPIVALVVAAVIVASVWSLTRDSLRLSLDGVPEGIDVADIERRMLSVEGVGAVHHIHIWAMSTTENALTAHVVLEDLTGMEQVKAELKRQLRVCGIPHATIEFETRSECCSDLGD